MSCVNVEIHVMHYPCQTEENFKKDDYAGRFEYQYADDGQHVMECRTCKTIVAVELDIDGIKQTHEERWGTKPPKLESDDQPIGPGDAKARGWEDQT